MSTFRFTILSNLKPKHNFFSSDLCKFCLFGDSLAYPRSDFTYCQFSNCRSNIGKRKKTYKQQLQVVENLSDISDLTHTYKKWKASKLSILLSDHRNDNHLHSAAFQ